MQAEPVKLSTPGTPSVTAHERAPGMLTKMHVQESTVLRHRQRGAFVGGAGFGTYSNTNTVKLPSFIPTPLVA